MKKSPESCFLKSDKNIYIWRAYRIKLVKTWIDGSESFIETCCFKIVSLQKLTLSKTFNSKKDKGLALARCDSLQSKFDAM